MATNTLLVELSQAIADAVELAGRAVVRVDARRRLPATGIVWSAADGLTTIVTASHVVERDEDITIVSTEEQELPATLVGRDHGSDLAVLRVEGVELVAARAAAGDIRPGALVFAVGRAADLSATLGVVSAVSASRGRGRRGSRPLVMSDAPMFPGFSGGPLIDVRGQVIGVLSSHLGRGATIAVPGEEVDRIVTSLITHGRVRQGYLGVAAQPITLPETLRRVAEAGQEQALLITGVEDESPAARAGLTIGDIILALDGRPANGLDELRVVLGGDAVGTTVSVATLRGGQPRSVDVVIGERGV